MNRSTNFCGPLLFLEKAYMFPETEKMKEILFLHSKTVEVDTKPQLWMSAELQVLHFVETSLSLQTLN